MEAVDEVLANEITEQHSNLKTTDIDKRIAILQHDLAEQVKQRMKVISKATVIRKIANDLMAMSLEGINNNFDDDSMKEFLGATLRLSL